MYNFQDLQYYIITSLKKDIYRFEINTKVKITSGEIHEKSSRS